MSIWSIVCKDETFNMLEGIFLLRKMKNKEKFVLTTKLLTDPNGKKMGKTEANMINLDDDYINTQWKSYVVDRRVDIACVSNLKQCN